MNITKKDEAILIGLTLGDGYLSKENKLRIIHCLSQKEYCTHKAKLLHSVVGGKDITVHESVHSYVYWEGNEKIKKIKPTVWIQKGSKSFEYLRKLIYPNGKKYISKDLLERLDIISIVLWWLDDGNVCIAKSGSGSYCASLRWNTFVSEEEAKVIVDYFKDKWSVTWHYRLGDSRTPDKYNLYCGKTEGEKFLQLIRDYVNTNIPSMSYKVIDLEQECKKRNALRNSLNTHNGKVCETLDKEPMC